MLGTAATGTTSLVVSDEEQRKNMLRRLRYYHVNHSFGLAAASLGSTNQFKGQAALLLGNTPLAECQFSDKHLAGALEKVDKGIHKLMKKYPGRKKP